MNYSEQAHSETRRHNYALAGLILLAHYHGIAINAEDIRDRFRGDEDQLDRSAWLLAARDMG